jgi:hypothetical protein
MPFETCIAGLTGDFTKDCKNPPILGLEENALIIPFDDIDRSATTFDATGTIITNLTLKAGAQKIKVQAFKKFKDGGYETKSNADAPDGAIHSFAFVSPKNDANAKKFINSLFTGAKCVVIVERKWKGAVKDQAFEVLGYDLGMGGTSTMKYYADLGSHVVTLKTPNEEQEPFVPYTWKETDYATTKAEFESWAA